MVGEHRRYLYGDSAGSEVGFDVLDMLQGLVECVRVLGIAHGEIAALRQQLEDSQRKGDAIAVELERFGDEARIGLGASGRQSTWPEVHQFADDMVQLVESSIASWKEEHRGRIAADRRALESAVQDHQRSMRSALEAFLLERALDVQSWAFETERVGDVLSSRLEYALPGDVRVAYDLDPPDGWAAPFKLREVVAPLELEVGLKKKLLRREPVPHRVVLSDYALVSLRCVPSGLRLSLVRKLTDPAERVDLELRRDGDGFEGVVHDAGGGFAPRATIPEDLPQLQKLWSAVVARIGEPGRHRRAIRGIWSSERPVEDAESMVAVAERFVAQARPIVRELVLHSPNAAELSVKVELEEGRREESWVEREVLQRKLLELPPAMLDRLAFPSLLPPGTLDRDDSLIDLSEIVEVEHGDSAVTVVSRLYPDASDRTDPSIAVVEAVVHDESSRLDLTDLATEADDDDDDPPTELHHAKG
jgi:hypothetical protein